MSGSIESENSADSKRGMRDPGLDVTGVHATVLGGRPVRPLVLHKLVMAGNCQAYVDQRLEDADFMPVPLTAGSGGWCFLNEVRRGYEIDWSDHLMLPEQADCVLTALGMLHMHVKCVIPEELGGDYKDEVSAACAGTVCRRWRTNFFVFLQQMLWWGMDETLAELFARHYATEGLEGTRWVSSAHYWQRGIWAERNFNGDWVVWGVVYYPLLPR